MTVAYIFSQLLCDLPTQRLYFLVLTVLFFHFSNSIGSYLFIQYKQILQNMYSFQFIWKWKWIWVDGDGESSREYKTEKMYIFLVISTHLSWHTYSSFLYCTIFFMGAHNKMYFFRGGMMWLVRHFFVWRK